MTTASIWIGGERRGDEISPWTLQLVSGAAALAATAKTPVGVLLGSAGAEDAAELAAHGADMVASYESAGISGSVEAAVAAARALLESEDPIAVLFPDSILGRDTASQLAASAGLPLASACERISEIGEEQVAAIRSCFGGQLSQRVSIPSGPCVVTVREHAFRASRTEGRPTPRLLSVTAPRDERIAVIERRSPSPETLDLAEAEVLVAGGRGVGEHGFSVLEDVARLLGGTTAASRAAVDEGWAESKLQVGQTGRTVAPRLYVACGISGAVQHMVGVRDAGVLVAINIDGGAPIMGDADLAALGDVSEVLPRLVSKLKESGA